MIKTANVKPLANWVLVKFEKDHETYQMDGKDTGILNALSVGTAGQRMNVFGEVIAVPSELRYLGKHMERAHKIYSDYTRSDGFNELEMQRTKLRDESVNYDVPMELKPGDKIVYFYKNQLDAFRYGAVLYDTDLGSDNVMFMRYDNIRATVIGEDELYPLNGAIFVEPLTLRTDELTDAGIILMEKKHMDMKVKPKVAYGRVKEVGCHCKGYLEFPGISDVKMELQPGDIICYDGRMARQLQFDLHQTLKTKRHIVMRKDIYRIVDDPSKFDFVE